MDRRSKIKEIEAVWFGTCHWEMLTFKHAITYCKTNNKSARDVRWRWIPVRNWGAGKMDGMYYLKRLVYNKKRLRAYTPLRNWNEENCACIYTQTRKSAVTHNSWYKRFNKTDIKLGKLRDHGNSPVVAAQGPNPRYETNKNNIENLYLSHKQPRATWYVPGQN